MINQEAKRTVRGARWNEHFVRPLYDTFGFACIPELIVSLYRNADNPAVAQRLLGPLADSYDKIILIFVDAFGWRFFQQYHERYAFLRRFVEHGVITPLTSQFPSTTAAHLTTIHTGLQVCESGIYEWYQYEPRLDRIIAPLPFSFAGDNDANTLLAAGLNPRTVFPESTIYHTLADVGVTSFVYSPESSTSSPFSSVVFDGARVVPYTAVQWALLHIVDHAANSDDPTYYFLYIGDIDSAGHHHGLDSPEFAAAVDACFSTLEAVLGNPPRGLRNALVLLTADHGQVETDPKRTIYLNNSLPEIHRWLQLNQSGLPLVPAGSSRDMFLHVRAEYLDQACVRLASHLEGRAEVYEVHDLIAGDFFGTAATSPAFHDRVGNLVILPYRNETVWWYEEGRFSHEFFAHHGGLTPEEAETVLLALRL